MSILHEAYQSLFEKLQITSEEQRYKTVVATYDDVVELIDKHRHNPSPFLNHDDSHAPLVDRMISAVARAVLAQGVN
ncbi:hypothetical protein [uncultured Halomonas sp.]|uniref:hypothetical protein n=1 Tax=uncultured Halomonas sp. TaxID=173971 RepID=UPI002604ACE5|nr:hypothetical protein [uncultured Halomonas sp.]